MGMTKKGERRGTHNDDRMFRQCTKKYNRILPRNPRTTGRVHIVQILGEDMKPRERLVSITRLGNGHAQVTVEKRGVLRRTTVTDMTLIDDNSKAAADRLAIIAGRGERVRLKEVAL